MSDDVRLNPPMSVDNAEELSQYRTLYDDITKNGTAIQYVDRHALGELAVTLCEMRRLRDELKNNGESMEVQGDRNQVTKKNPAREALQKLYPVMMKLFGEFKMTPNSRGKTINPGNTPVGGSNDGFGDI